LQSEADSGKNERLCLKNIQSKRAGGMAQVVAKRRRRRRRREKTSASPCG
jgi:hypothetical protein